MDIVNWRLEMKIKDCKFETGDWRLKIGNWRLKWRLEIGDMKLETED